MSSPKISVIMPVYNASPYLREAIQSILSQTFTDFECIIINDGSTDQSENIILSFSDNRIRYAKNQSNSGLVFTLNKGIDMATGEWIARMDGDDISLPDRFEKQFHYLNQNPEMEVLATRVKLIDENGFAIGSWKDDERAITPEQIRLYLPKNNCIAHPTIMMKTSLLKKYRYNSRQSQAEDYDLWLRLSSDQVSIHKLDEALVKHRILPSSFTRKNRQNIYYKLALTKYRFGVDALKKGKLNAFVIRSVLHSFLDFIKGSIKTLLPK